MNKYFVRSIMLNWFGDLGGYEVVHFESDAVVGTFKGQGDKPGTLIDAKADAYGLCERLNKHARKQIG